ncbi:MAG: matrixin family metalloprotease [Chloroflexota bacterium]|nr:matrixin family metalloprotease [Chloroflexota bacterium]
MRRFAGAVTMVFLMAVGAVGLYAQTSIMLRYGEPIDGALAGGGTVEYTFLAEAGDPLLIIANAKGGEIDPYLQLYAPDGTLIAEDDDGGGKRNARIEGVSAPETGVHRVRLTNKLQGGGGNYALIINNAAEVIAYHGGGVDSPFAVDPGYQGYQLSEPWGRTDLTYVIVNIIGGFPEGAVEQVIAEGFQAWTNNTPLTFTRVADQNADIVVQFSQIDGSSQVLGQACPPSSPCAGSVEFDIDENWTLYEPQQSNDISLIGVATHEFGHIVGLLHSSDASALMYPQYSPYNLQPSDDDIAGVQRLYGAGRGGVLGAPTSVPGAGGEGDTIISAITDEQYVEFWDFEAAAGEYVTISMTALDGGLDPLLIILDANDNVLAYDDDSAGDLNAVVLNIRFPESGTYTVAATRFEQVQGYSEGRYELAMEMGFTDAPTPSGGASVPVPTGGAVQVSEPTRDVLASTPNLAAGLDTAFADSVTPSTQSATASVNAGESYIWSVTWCAADNGALERSLRAIDVGFAVEGRAVPDATVGLFLSERDGLACADYAVLLSGWSGAGVRLTATMRLAGAVFDGISIYQPGDYVYEYAVRVE